MPVVDPSDIGKLQEPVEEILYTDNYTSSSEYDPPENKCKEKGNALSMKNKQKVIAKKVTGTLD